MADDQNTLLLKIQQYEKFVNEVLRSKLKSCFVARENYLSEIQEYLQLKKTIDNLNELDVNPLKTKVDLGCGFFVQAEVPDVSMIFVSVGFGFFLELTHPEACSFIIKKVEQLGERVKVLEDEASHINADIKMMLNTLGQLQGIIPSGKLNALTKQSNIWAGGAWAPTDCTSKYRVNIVIPYRARQEQLRAFLHYFHRYLQSQEIAYQIIVIEQSQEGEFNRGKLFNIGFVESQKRFPSDCYIFHDVDLIPQSLNNIYACAAMPRHLSSAVDTFSYQLPYCGIFGG
uniref:EOG090X0MWD n=1 Tax=Daphnia dolichocephala TaxID=2282166 RepID=A0A4Y7M7H7_9CRUS|nr:EOG090X0MWD [Daphnia dolichocephala]